MALVVTSFALRCRRAISIAALDVSATFLAFSTTSVAFSFARSALSTALVAFVSHVKGSNIMRLANLLQEGNVESTSLIRYFYPLRTRPMEYSLVDMNQIQRYILTMSGFTEFNQYPEMLFSAGKF